MQRLASFFRRPPAQTAKAGDGAVWVPPLDLAASPAILAAAAAGNVDDLDSLLVRIPIRHQCPRPLATPAWPTAVSLARPG